MKIKKLEVIGFKSFSDKASISFPAGISAIVGPNGCGKSNIVDALRWVMGEQSVKQLRGKSMEDVIFAGANGNPPVNMAEVSLTLLNDNGSAPEALRDFTEIMLTRRIYRSGESAYLINKQPCRLKDIHNLFLGSGMGSKSYAVIQQGNIGAITDAGPDERRFFIEEAAGVTRYRARKDEALRKVQATGQNLLRVKDILVELNRQITGLKRQANKAERFKIYQDQIKHLDISLAVRSYDDFSERIDEVGQLLKSLKDTDLGQQTALKQIDAAIEKIKLEHWQKNQEIADQKSRKFEIQRKLDRTETDLAHFRRECHRLGSEMVRLESARQELEAKNRDIDSEVTQAEHENSELQNDIAAVGQTLKREHEAARHIKDKLFALHQSHDRFTAELAELSAQEARCRNIYQNASSNRENLRRRLKRIDEEVAIAENNVKNLSDKKTGVAEHLQQVKGQIDDLKRQVADLQELLNGKSTALGSMVKNVQALDLERHKIRSRYSALKRMEDNFDWYKDGVKVIMQKAAHPEQMQDILGVMADAIEPQPSFETAVEAALGDCLQYILVKDHAAAAAAIGFLQAQGAGRSGFIPVSDVAPIDDNPQKKPNSPHRLLKHVSVKPGLEPIVEALLGHVVVADSLEAALTLWNRNGVVQTIVTKTGDLITHQGLLIGGSRDKLSGILSKKLELKSLKQQLSQMDLQLETARRKQSKLESEVRSLESNLQQLIQKKNQAVQVEIEAEKALYGAGQDLKHARRHLEIAALEQEQLMGEEMDIDAEMAKYNAAMGDLAAALISAQSNVDATKEKINTVSVQMESYNQKSVDLKLRLTALNAKLENSSNTLRRLKEFGADGTRRLEDLSQEICQKHDKKHTAEKKIAEYDQSLATLYGDMEQLEKTLESNVSDYQSITGSLKENDRRIADIQNQRQETLEKIRVLELEQSQLVLQRTNVANRIEERYHHPLSRFKPELQNTAGSPGASAQEMQTALSELRQKIAAIGDVNLGAIEEYEQLKERFDFITAQKDDLEKAIEDLHKVIKKINKITKEKFMETFELVNDKLNHVFPRLFEGGSARLILTEPDNPLESGVEFMIHPPGKKLTRMSLLSGGEKALSAIAFVFSIFLIKPASFCLMDEIDAPLDDANVHRFNHLLKIIGEQSQIIMITHNKRSMEFADMLFGVTMAKKGISKVVSVNFERPASESAN